MNFSIATAFITAGITLIGGVILFAIQQVLDKSIFVPLQKQKDTIEDLAIMFIHYASLYANPMNYGGELWDSPHRKLYTEASSKTREFTCVLKVRSDNVPFYNTLTKIGRTVSKKDINQAYLNLMTLSNSYSNVGRGLENSKLVDETRGLLGIPLLK